MEAIVASLLLSTLGAQSLGTPATKADLSKIHITVDRSGLAGSTDSRITEWYVVYVRNDSDEILIDPAFRATEVSGSLREPGVLRKVVFGSMVPGSFHRMIAPHTWSQAQMNIEFPIDVFTFGRHVEIRIAAATKLPAGIVTNSPSTTTTTVSDMGQLFHY